MTTLTSFVASVVVHSSAAAFSHLGLTLEPVHTDRPAAERVVSRSHASAAPQKLSACPDRLVRPRVDRI